MLISRHCYGCDEIKSDRDLSKLDVADFSKLAPTWQITNIVLYLLSTGK